MLESNNVRCQSTYENVYKEASITWTQGYKQTELECGLVTIAACTRIKEEFQNRHLDENVTYEVLCDVVHQAANGINKENLKILLNEIKQFGREMILELNSTLRNRETDNVVAPYVSPNVTLRDQEINNDVPSPYVSPNSALRYQEIDNDVPSPYVSPNSALRDQDMDTLYAQAARMNANFRRMNFPLVRFGSKNSMDEYFAATVDENNLVVTNDNKNDVPCKVYECTWRGKKRTATRHYLQCHESQVLFCAYHLTRTVVPIMDYRISIFKIHKNMIKYNYLIYSTRPNNNFNEKSVLMNVFWLEERFLLKNFLDNANPGDKLAEEIRRLANDWMTENSPFVVTELMKQLRKEKCTENQYERFLENMLLQIE